MSGSYVSGMAEADWRYPLPAPRASGWMPAGAHRIYWEEYGAPEGEPVMFLHGGPGGGTSPIMARLFDPKRYRVILFDQRGCGKSTPSAADADAAPALADNTTPHLIADILKLREALGITGKMHLFGGSWGSTLALAYAIGHPETVETLILRGIFLCRKVDLDYFYQGNAVYYDKNPQDCRLPGTYLSYPEAWKIFVEMIPPEERGDMIAAYAKRFAMQPRTEAEKSSLTETARAWSLWEGSTVFLAPARSELEKFSDPTFARAFARIENHYFMNGAFLGGSGAANREQNYLLANAAALQHIAIHIVHGRYDQVCPLFQAEDLVAALKAAGAERIDYRVTPAGHSMMERENCHALAEIMHHLPPMRR